MNPDRLARLRTSVVAASAACMALIGVAAPASAHHSFAMYDHEKTFKWQGTVSAFHWTNPHIYVDVVFPEGAANKQWTLEGTAIPMLTRIGWSSKSLKPGDKVTAQFAPMKNGTPAGILMEVTFTDGKVLNTGLPGQNSYAKPQ